MTAVPEAATAPPEISVVVPTYRRPALVERLLRALEDQTLDRHRFEVVVVDNGSDDTTPEVLAKVEASTPLQLRVLRIDENDGPAPARNLGWRSARAPYVAFTDDDCVPRPDWLEQALSSCRATPDLGVLQGATLRPSEPYAYGPGTVYRETLTPSPYFEGCNLVFPREVLETTGGFDESYHFGGEDTAAGWAAIELGRRWLFDETCAVTHDVTERPLRWHLMMAWREGNLVDVAARHPRFRREGLWRPWAHRPWNAAFLGVPLAVLLAPRRPRALLLAVPWLVLRRPPWRRPRVLGPALARMVLSDTVACAGMVRGSVRNRRLVL